MKSFKYSKYATYMYFIIGEERGDSDLNFYNYIFFICVNLVEVTT